jgi:hypothetical protein
VRMATCLARLRASLLPTLCPAHRSKQQRGPAAADPGGHNELWTPTVQWGEGDLSIRTERPCCRPFHDLARLPGCKCQDCVQQSEALMASTCAAAKQHARSYPEGQRGGNNKSRGSSSQGSKVGTGGVRTGNGLCRGLRHSTAHRTRPRCCTRRHRPPGGRGCSPGCGLTRSPAVSRSCCLRQIACHRFLHMHNR